MEGRPASMEGPCDPLEGLMGPPWGIHGTAFRRPLEHFDGPFVISLK